MKSKDYSRRFVTSSGKLDDGPCELISAHLVPSGATTSTILYNGISASGEKIIALERTTVDNLDFAPPVPVFCPSGLYITVGTNVTGVLVIWRSTRGD
jgi:hypothetical protein